MWPEETDAVPSWFAWSSHHLDDVTTLQEFFDRSASLKALFDGAMFIAMGPRYHPFELTRPTAEHFEDQNFLSYFEGPGDLTVDPFSPRHLLTRHRLSDSHLDDPLTRSLFLARYDTTVQALLKYIGYHGLTFVSLYALRDWMNDAGWNDDKVAEEAGWSKARLRDFTGTANNPVYLGPHSRHGGTKAKPLKRPMEFSEADRGMRRATQHFLLERAEHADLHEKWKALS